MTIFCLVSLADVFLFQLLLCAFGTLLHFWHKHTGVVAFSSS